MDRAAFGAASLARPRPEAGRASEAYAVSMRAAARTVRYWGPVVAGVMCLVAMSFVGLLASWLLLLAAFALILDGATAMFARAGGTGGITSHRQ